MMRNSQYLARKLENSGKFEVINKEGMFPLVTVSLKDEEFTVFQLSEKLRQKGWIVPAYTLPENADDVAVMRMVVKENFGREMVDLLVEDVMESLESLEREETTEKKIKDNPSLLY